MNDRDRICTLEPLVLLAFQHGHFEEAIRDCSEVQRARRRLTSHVLPGLSMNEQLAYLSGEPQKTLAVGLSIGLRNAERPDAVNASAEWLLNGKALSGELLAEQIRLGRQSTDPALAATVKELTEVRGQLAHLVLSPAQPPGDSGNSSNARLDQRERELSRQLGQQTLSAASGDAWVRLNDLRKNVPAGCVLIDIAKFHVYRADSGVDKWDNPRYAAWVIPPAGGGDVKLVDLGDAETIDQSVAKCRLSVEAFPALLRRIGDRKATDIAAAVIARLSALVWQPLEKAVGDAPSLIISPDGALWLFPWEALSTREGKFLVEHKEISYLVTGRQLAARHTEKSGMGGAIFADPDYDMELADSATDHPGAWSDASKSLVPGGPGGLLAGAKVNRLPGAAAEADAFAAALRGYLGVTPRRYERKLALESEFKKLHGPRVLVISTHGFFVSDQAFDNLPLTEEAKRVWARYNLGRVLGLGKPSEPIVPNPLLRCGVALAGANRRQNARGANDGVLTGLEILNTDLGETELVVLKACETGVGAVHEAEGTTGLHQAFQLAGARTVIASLWPIPMKPSSLLMQAFFENLAKKQGKAAALRNAHIRLIRHMRETAHNVHPALWAGFILIGDPH